MNAQGPDENAIAGAARAADERVVVLAAVGEEGGGQVVEVAARQVRRTWPDSHLHLVHVFRTGMFDRAPPGGMSNSDLIDEAKLLLEHHVRMARRQCSVPIEGHFAIGSPAKEIIRLAKQLNVDLIVIGKTDHMALDRLLMGSVAESVVRAARCSVFVARAREHHTADMG